MQVYREFSMVRHVCPDSEMCEFWVDPTVEILVGSAELNALETEFGILFDDDTALDIYEMSVRDAAERIEEMIQGQSREKYSSMQIIEDITPENAKRILREIWADNFKYRDYIMTVIEKIKHEDNTKG
jgi:hypothetical protein